MRKFKFVMILMFLITFNVFATTTNEHKSDLLDSIARVAKETKYTESQKEEKEAAQRLCRAQEKARQKKEIMDLGNKILKELDELVIYQDKIAEKLKQIDSSSEEAHELRCNLIKESYEVVKRQYVEEQALIDRLDEEERKNFKPLNTKEKVDTLEVQQCFSKNDTGKLITFISEKEDFQGKQGEKIGIPKAYKIILDRGENFKKYYFEFKEQRNE